MTFTKGHKTNLGRIRSLEERIKMSENAKHLWSLPEYRNKNIKSHIGIPKSLETIKKLSESQKGRIKSETHRKNLSISHKGKRGKRGSEHPMWGKHHSEESRKKISISQKGKNIGKRKSEETRRKISTSKQGDKSYTWKGGISFEPYCPKFNEHFKNRVRKHFNYTCIICGKFGNCVHHVNYDKMVCCNDAKPIFAVLCKSCHTMTNHNREYWEETLTNKILLEYNGVSYE